MTARKPTKPTGTIATAAKPVALISDVRSLILQAREGVARAVDSTLTTLYWHIGRRVVQDVLKEKRAGYGEEIVSALQRQLTRAHFKLPVHIEAALNRDFYAEMWRLETGKG